MYVWCLWKSEEGVTWPISIVVMTFTQLWALRTETGSVRASSTLNHWVNSHSI